MFLSEPIPIPEVASSSDEQGDGNPALGNVQYGQPVLACQFLKHACAASLECSAERCGSAAPESGSAADAVRRRLQPVVRCCTGLEERPFGSLTREPCAYGQS